MKKIRALGGMLGTAALLGSLCSPAYAATTSTNTAKPQHQLQQKAIYYNNKIVSKPYGFVVNGTTYMPVWYVMHTLDAAKIVNKWTGSAWTITTPQGTTVDLSKISVGTGAISISINGKLVKKVNGIADIDPSTGNKTMYMPVWYVMNILTRLHVNTVWTGTAWKLTPAATPSGGTSGSSSGTGSTSGSGSTTGSGSTSGGAGSSSGSGSTSSGGTSGTGSGPGGSSTSTTPPPPPPPPTDNNPQAAQIPGAVSKGQMVADLATALGLTATSLPATSPYDDLPTSSPLFTPDEAALQRGLVTPFFTATVAGQASHFGTGDVASLQDAEQFYWNYLNIKYASYQPGGTLSQWADSIGLTQGLTSNTTYLTQTEEQQLITNLKGLLQGLVVNGSVMQMRYTPHDEYTWTFSGAQSDSGVPYYSGSTVQQAITNTYAFYNAITMQVVGNELQVTIPVNSDKRWFAYVSSQNGIQYSTNGGGTWTNAGSFDGSTVTAYGTVLLRAPLADGMSITYNNMSTTALGSVILGWVNISQNPDYGQTTSSSGTPSPILVQRVTLN